MKNSTRPVQAELYGPPRQDQAIPAVVAVWHDRSSYLSHAIRNLLYKKNLGIPPAWLGKELERVSVSRMSGVFQGSLPDCTGVKTGVTLVNSESKLLVSVAFLIVGIKGGVTLLL